jgi:hypothetical protein
MGGEADLIHEISGSQMLLIGRQADAQAGGTAIGEGVQQREVEPRIILEPVGDQLVAAQMRRDRLQGRRQRLRQPDAADDDIVPVRSEKGPGSGLRR